MKPDCLRIFAVADVHSPSAFRMAALSGADFDVVLTLGDIDVDTLDYILFMGRAVPAYGVPGNHDPKDVPGLANLHCKVVDVNGLKIGGFGGCRRYKDAPWHFVEKQVARSMKRMPPVDIFISHAPPLATSADEDEIHRGFAAFDDYIARHHPAYWLHGHLDRRYQTVVGTTTVIGITDRMPLVLSFQGRP